MLMGKMTDDGFCILKIAKKGWQTLTIEEFGPKIMFRFT
jgi:hypothetical protein